MKKIIISILLFTSLFANALTKRDFVQKVKKSNGYEKIALNVKLANKQLDFISSNDWLMSFKINQLDRKKQENLLIQSYAKGNTTFTSSVSKDIDSTGGNVAVAYNYAKNNYETSTNDYHDNQLSLSYTHPLLKNAFGIVDNLAEDLAEYDVKIAQLNVVNQQQTFVVSKLKVFLNWLKFERQLEIHKKQLELAQKLLKRTEKKYKKSLVNEVDVLAQMELVLLREQNILNVEQALFQVKDELAKTLEDDEILNEKVLFDLDKLFAASHYDEKIENTTKIKALKLEIAKAKRNIKTLENKEQASLDLSVSALKHGQDYNSYNDSLNNSSSDYQIGIQYTDYLGGSSTEAAIAKARIALEQQELEYKDLVNIEKSKLSTLKNKLVSLKKQLVLAKQRLTTAQKKSKQQQQRYDLAQIDISLVINALNSQQNIELEQLNYQVLYQSNYYDYLRILDLMK